MSRSNGTVTQNLEITDEPKDSLEINCINLNRNYIEK